MSSFSFDRSVSISSSVLSSSMVDESILLDLTREKYFSLDDVGTQMWKVLIESDSIQTAVDTLFEQYDVPYQLLQTDIEQLIEKLLASGLIEISDSQD